MGKVVVLDFGHGGVINGEYQTSGKRSPKWSKGILFEGMFNRWVGYRVIEQLDRKEIPYYCISPEHTDTSLQTRSDRANKIYQDNPNTWLFSLHANAGGGKGIEGFTTVGITSSDILGETVLKNLETDGVNVLRTDMSDGDRDKESNFWMLRKPFMPAFLLECGFMDQQADYNNLWSQEYLEKLVNSIVRSIEEIYKA